MSLLSKAFAYISILHANLNTTSKSKKKKTKTAVLMNKFGIFVAEILNSKAVHMQQNMQFIHLYLV